MGEREIGHVTHYFGHIGVAGVKITDGTLKVGDVIHVLGHTSDFTQPVESMQIEHDSVEEAHVGDEIGLKVLDHAREHDAVLLVSE